MPPSISYLDYIKDLFAPFGVISIRRMFGGAGVYCDGDFFAIVAGDALWLKADAETRAKFEAAGSHPFVYKRGPGGEGRMSYYAAPDEIYDDEDALRHWTGLALAAARRAKRPRKKRSV